MKMRSRRRVLRKRRARSWVATAMPQPISTHGNQRCCGVSHRLTAAHPAVMTTKATKWARKMRIDKSLNMPRLIRSEPAYATLAAASRFDPEQDRLKANSGRSREALASLLGHLAADLWAWRMFADCSCDHRIARRSARSEPAGLSPDAPRRPHACRSRRRGTRRPHPHRRGLELSRRNSAPRPSRG
jgi:hypothetical protein